MIHNSLELNRLKASSIRVWLRKGWHDFTKTLWISLIYSSIICVVGLLAAGWSLNAGKLFLFVSLAGGFMLIAPIFALGFYQVAEMLRKGQQPTLRDFFRSYTKNLWISLAFGMLLVFVFVIWITDALLIYGLFLGGDPISFSQLTEDPEAIDKLRQFIMIGGGVGGVLAFIIYVCTVFSLPDAFHRGVGFPIAIGTSARGVFQNFSVMLLWAIVLALLTLGTLFVALPLIIVLFPVLGYASYAAYLDLIGELSTENSFND